MRKFSPEEIRELNEHEAKKNAADFEEFKADLANGICWICKQPLTSFDEDKPCQHWLLLPKGFRKKHFKKIFAACTYDKLEGFLRWYVNAHEPAKNINDLKMEHGSDKIKSVTIKHENLEWSFSFSKNCVEGKHGAHGPHYHFQVRVDGRPMFDYSDRHIPLSKYELWFLDIEQGNNPDIKKIEVQGVGMQGLLDSVGLEKLLESMKSTDDYEKAQFNVSSVVMASDDKGISGDDFNALLKEHRETRTPLHQLIKKLPNVRSTVIVEPGPGVPEAAPRTRRTRGKKRK